MEGRDVLGLAQTGTGKTAAFVLPILHRLVGGSTGRRIVKSLIVAPTRELADQICECVRELGQDSGIQCCTVYGGVSMSGQIQRLRRGVDIVVGCPGRILDHINQRTIDLRGLEVLVLDEADHMFDMGFLPDIRKILKVLPRNRQTLLFSATMPNEVRGLATDILNNPVQIKIGDSAPTKTVSHAIYSVEQAHKTELLLEVLKRTDTDSVLIFTRTKHRAKRLGDTLSKAGYRSASLQGNLSQNRRKEALDGFRDGRFQVLVATDIAARGIDVASVTHVINFDIPNTVDAYTHRIGRTGRAERTGDALTFVSRSDAPMVREIERRLGKPIERKVLEGFKPSANAATAAAESRGDDSSMDRPDRGFRNRGGSGGRNRFNQRGRAGGYRSRSRGFSENRPAYNESY